MLNRLEEALLDRGLRWEEYRARIQVNQEIFDEVYQSPAVAEQDLGVSCIILNRMTELGRPESFAVGSRKRGIWRVRRPLAIHAPTRQERLTNRKVSGRLSS